MHTGTWCPLFFPNSILAWVLGKSRVFTWMFFRWEGLSFRIFTKNKERVRAIGATKYKKYMAGNLLTHAHLCRESTQIEYSSQKTAQQVWNIKLNWKTQLLFKLFTYQVKSHCITGLYSRDMDFGTPCTVKNSTNHSKKIVFVCSRFM